RIDLAAPLALTALTALAALKRHRNSPLPPVDAIAPIAHAPFGSSTVGSGQSFHSRTACLAHDIAYFRKEETELHPSQIYPMFPRQANLCGGRSQKKSKL